MITQATKTQRTLKGTVVSGKMDKTVIVLVNRYIQDPKYKKYLRRSKRYKVHDPENKYKVGDIVEIVKCAPVSKDKHHKVL